ncbi:Serine/threonine-protein phosphatase 4 regulatory subunit 4 [Gracilaria domingensis]|nr:Serine/threonine-protein phosphatase 4 regulatory subunit 4 [Gracilaria domingensis]
MATETAPPHAPHPSQSPSPPRANGTTSSATPASATVPASQTHAYSTIQAPNGLGADPEMHPSDSQPDEQDPKTFDPETAGVEFVVLNDEVLTSVANATLVLLDGSDLERLAVMFQFPQFLEHCPDDTLQIMVPEICRDAVRWKDEVQMAAAEALYFVVNMHIPETIAKRIVVAALRIIQMSESGDVFDAWGEILSMMLPQVKRDDVKSLVVPATMDRASSPTVESRRLAARIIGSLNDALTAKELEEQFLGQAMRLCDDQDPSVRAMIAQSLASVGAKLPLRVSERQLWPKLDSLMTDDNARVRAAAMRAVARSAEAHKMECLNSPSFKNMLLPTFLRECATASTVASSDLRNVDDDTYLMLEIFSEVYGYLLCAVHSLFANEETWNTALNSLRRMVTCNGPTVRHWCAFNVPAVAVVCGSKRPEKIRGVVHALSADTDVETRATLAAGIHETARVLGNGELRDEILQAIANLMTDQNPQVRMNSLSHFAELLILLSTGPGDGPPLSPNAKDSPARELSPVFQSLETMSHDSWRTQELLAKQIDQCANRIPQDMLCEHVAPLLFQMARESTYLVRRASISALVSVVRYIPDVRRRDHILKHFRSEWARGKVYWTRLAFIDGSTAALKLLSHRLFTHLFASELLSLSRDSVANVRLRLTRLMPEIATACGTKTAFKNAMESLLNDPDDEIRREAEVAQEKIKNAPPLTPEMETENSAKEAAERRFFIQRQKKRNANKDGASEGSRNPDFKGPMRRNASFTNNTDGASGAKQTVVIHSVLGAPGYSSPENLSPGHLAATPGGQVNGQTESEGAKPDGRTGERPRPNGKAPDRSHGGRRKGEFCIHSQDRFSIRSCARVEAVLTNSNQFFDCL